MQVLVDQFAAIGILRTDGGVIGALRGGKTLFGKTQRAPRIWVDNGVFLLKAEPEIVVVVVNGRPAVAGVCAAVGAEDFGHDQPAVAAEAVGIGEDGDGLQ